jgi:hyperosmotically inducible periplasmic protein
MKNINVFKFLSFAVLTLLATPLYADVTFTHGFSSTEGDATITASLKDQIASDNALSNLNVKINVDNGVVTLSGVVDSDSQVDALVTLVESTQGVTDVNAPKLTVKSSKQPFTDTLITSKIKGIFIKEKIFSKEDIAAVKIHVETRNGVVYLTGTADNAEQADNAVKLARSVSGVTKVKSTVKTVNKGT